MIVIKNEHDEIIYIRIVTRWCMCSDYRKLNEANQKDHFPLTFIDQMLEMLAMYSFFYYLERYSSFFQIPIRLTIKIRMTFTFPYGTFAYRMMPSGLCNTPTTF